MESSSEVVSVDGLQTQIDKFMLTIFEAIRNESGTEASKSNSDKLHTEYSNTLNFIDNLVAVDIKEQDQKSNMTSLSNEIEVSQQRILALEINLHQLRQSIDEKLNEVL